MGYRIHCSPVYQVKYGDGHFSHHTAELNRFLCEHSDEFQWTGEDVETAERVSIPRAELAKIISWITTHRREFDAWLVKYDFGCSVNQFIEIVCEWIATSDHRNEFVVLTWF